MQDLQTRQPRIRQHQRRGRADTTASSTTLFTLIQKQKLQLILYLSSQIHLHVWPTTKTWHGKYTISRSRSITNKQDIIHSKGKIQKLGYVDYVNNLPIQTQLMLKNHPMQHFLPWRAVWKGNSVSTPCRVLFDASMSTSSGYSLNDILAKGRNNLNNLQEILWSTKPTAIHSDITKMYNTIQLKESDWCYQRYLWQEELELGKQPDEKIVKTSMASSLLVIRQNTDWGELQKSSETITPKSRKSSTKMYMLMTSSLARPTSNQPTCVPTNWNLF